MLTLGLHLFKSRVGALFQFEDEIDLRSLRLIPPRDQ